MKLRTRTNQVFNGQGLFFSERVELFCESIQIGDERFEISIKDVET
jgi:hypothetical protein